MLIAPTANATQGHQPEGRGAGRGPLDGRRRAAAAVRARPHGDGAGDRHGARRRRRCHGRVARRRHRPRRQPRATLPSSSQELAGGRLSVVEHAAGPGGARRRRPASPPAARLDAQVLRAEGGAARRHAARHVRARPAPRRGRLHARRRRDARARHLRHAARAQEPGDARRDRRRALRRRRAPARRPLAMAPRRPAVGRLARAGPAAAGAALLHRARAAAVLGDRQERRLQPLDRRSTA